jgi:hypothetical protein
MTDTQIKKIVEEVRGEQQISPMIEDTTIESYIKEAEYSINNSSGELIKYEEDLEARSLLKNYVLYASYKRLAEFKELYGGEYAKLQIKYYKPTELQ